MRGDVGIQNSGPTMSTEGMPTTAYSFAICSLEPLSATCRSCPILHAGTRLPLKHHFSIMVLSDPIPGLATLRGPFIAIE